MPRVFKIALGETVEIPANSEMTTSGIFSENTPHFSTAMVEEYTNKLAEKGIFVAKSVIDTYNQVIPLRLLNLNDFPTKLYKSSRLQGYNLSPLITLSIPEAGETAETPVKRYRNTGKVPIRTQNQDGCVHTR